MIGDAYREICLILHIMRENCLFSAQVCDPCGCCQ
jgi:hypothetical protein